jgi:hypothetical protein
VRDCLQHPVDILEDLIVPKAQDAIVVIAKPLVANGVASAFCVLPAINLNDQALLAAHQVHSVGTNGLLANEFHSAERARADTVPQSLFRNGGRAAKVSRGVRLSGFCATHEEHLRAIHADDGRPAKYQPLRLVERPPHPARKSAPTSPRTRGEVKRRGRAYYR